MGPITFPGALTIGAVSKQTGVNIETIRYYERIGLLVAPGRTPGGNRLYDDSALARLGFVKRCRQLGFSIDEIRSLLTMVDRSDFTCGEVHKMTVDHLAEIRSKIATLNRMAAVLDDMVSKCDQGSVPQCPIVDALCDED